MKKPILYILSFSVFTASCATIKHEDTADGRMESFIGKDYKYTIRWLGPPDYIYSDSDDGRILHWDFSYNATTMGTTYVTGDLDDLWAVAIHRPPQTYRHEQFAQFYVNPKGKVYHYRHNMQTEEEMQYERDKRIFKAFWVITGTAAGLLVILALMPQQEAY